MMETVPHVTSGLGLRKFEADGFLLTRVYLYISTSRSMCAVPNMAVFCTSLISSFPGMLLRYFLSDYEIVPLAPVITGITFAFTFPTR